MKYCVLFFLLVPRFFLLNAKEIVIAEVTLDHAQTPEKIGWGLMKVSSMPENHGMLFHFPENNNITMWMFNCLMDLSVAFLDKNQKVVAIHELKAFPDRMDPTRPVNSLSDIGELYPHTDRIVRFFRRNSIRSQWPAAYALEMNAGWFAKREILPGDTFRWQGDKGEFLRGAKADSSH